MQPHEVYSLRARDIVNRNIAIVSPLTTIHETVEKMVALGCQAAVVDRADESDAYGLVTFQEIAYRVMAGALSPTRTRAADVMVKPLIVVTPNLRLPFVAQLFARFNIQHAIVIDDHKLVGVIATSDLAKALIMERPE